MCRRYVTSTENPMSWILSRNVTEPLWTLIAVATDILAEPTQHAQADTSIKLDARLAHLLACCPGWSNCRSQLGSKSGATLFLCCRNDSNPSNRSGRLTVSEVNLPSHLATVEAVMSVWVQDKAKLLLPWKPPRNVRELRDRDTKHLRTPVCISANMLHLGSQSRVVTKKGRQRKSTRNEKISCNILQEPRVVCLVASIKF